MEAKAVVEQVGELRIQNFGKGGRGRGGAGGAVGRNALEQRGAEGSRGVAWCGQARSWSWVVGWGSAAHEELRRMAGVAREELLYAGPASPPVEVALLRQQLTACTSRCTRSRLPSRPWRTPPQREWSFYAQAEAAERQRREVVVEAAPVMQVGLVAPHGRSYTCTRWGMRGGMGAPTPALIQFPAAKAGCHYWLPCNLASQPVRPPRCPGRPRGWLQHHVTIQDEPALCACKCPAGCRVPRRRR